MSKVALEQKATTTIIEYMLEQNRPYAATDVFNNLHQQFGKTLVVKCLDSGAESGALREKIISKQKIYYANQDNMEVCNEEELAKMDKEIAEKTEQQNELSAKLKALSSELNALESSLTTSELTKAIESLETQLAEMEEQKANLEAVQDTASVDEKDNAEKRFLNYDKIMRQRKRLAEDMISVISENYPKKKNILLEEMGVEVD